MAKTGKKVGAPKKHESEKLLYSYRTSFNYEQNEALKAKAKKMLGVDNVQLYIHSLALRDIM